MFKNTNKHTKLIQRCLHVVSLLQADDIRALLIDAMPPDALPSCLKPLATVVSVCTQYRHRCCLYVESDEVLIAEFISVFNLKLNVKKNVL